MNEVTHFRQLLRNNWGQPMGPYKVQIAFAEVPTGLLPITFPERLSTMVIFTLSGGQRSPSGLFIMMHVPAVFYLSSSSVAGANL